ncbi:MULTISPECIES: hypothetical protein [Bacillus cereus group]|uniref:hypothetical protein n=1 Tax=Bacillus cereus group TaxID=86661 RepID=UPI0002799DA4|nr:MULTISPECIES: hypothetical protein [Bacillus cereus group]EJR95119.1 hypothetical protein IKO_05810 [Bacillus cereus VDM034]OOQ93142.1 hypothetical protein BW898_20420 [Bacillus cereus]QWI25389.1 hypothetical protein EXW34_29765 [Bacillus mycoides]
MENYLKEKHRREKLEQIFNRTIKGESYFQCDSFRWKNIVFKHYNKIKRKEMSIEQLVSIIQKEGIAFTQHPSLITYPIIDFIKYIAKICKETIEIESC